VIIYWSEEGQVFIAEMPELPDRAGEGKTYQAGLVSAQRVGIADMRVPTG
jgi:predicted RNase H-like HicB family nuclease